MCYVVLRQLLIFVIIFAGKGTSLSKVVDLKHVYCACCELPQPRSVVLSQEAEIFEDTLPYMTLLHRCDAGSGCCKKGMICKVAKWEMFNATFLVKDQNKKKYVEHFMELTNHTKCSCQISNDTPK